jgi:hypothetical protein
MCVAELTATGLLMLRMVVVGFLQPPGRLLSWPMFTRGCYLDVQFQVGERRIDALELVPSYAPALTPADIEMMADYVAERYGPVHGTGRMWFVEGAADIRVEDGHVVV